MTPDPKEEVKAMKAEERAEKLVQALLVGVNGSYFDFFLEQIKQAEIAAYAEGFKAAREKAADILSRWAVCGTEGPRLMSGTSVIDRIRSLSPEREESK